MSKLIVEDRQEVLEAVKAVLVEEGFEVRSIMKEKTKRGIVLHRLVYEDSNNIYTTYTNALEYEGGKAVLVASVESIKHGKLFTAADKKVAAQKHAEKIVDEVVAMLYNKQVRSEAQ